MFPETRYARRGDVHIAYQVLGEGDLDLVLVSEWFSHLDARWDLPSWERFLLRLVSFDKEVCSEQPVVR